MERDETLNNKIYENAFEWRFEFPEVLNDDGQFIGFDVVIGNPPYILSRENFSNSAKNYFKENFFLTHEKPNLYILFIERAFHILRLNGQFGFIIPNSLSGVESAYKIREMLLKQKQIERLINLVGETFDDVGVESCVLLVSNCETKSKIRYTTLQSGEIKEENFFTVDPEIWAENRNFLFDISSSPEEMLIISKIKSASQVLDNEYDVRVGLQAYETGKGNPKQASEDVKNHVYDYDYKFDENTYRYLNGSDIGRYKLQWTGQWLRYGKWLSQPKSFDQFSNPRILIREITGSYPYLLESMYVDEVFLNNKSILNVLQKSQKYSLQFLLGYLNSKLVGFYHKRQTVKGNRNLFPKIVIKDLKNYPIPKKVTDQFALIEGVVDKILLEKTKHCDTTQLENQIDELVYQLYGLTEEEIRIVEGV